MRMCSVWYRAGSCILPKGHKDFHQNQEGRRVAEMMAELERLRSLLGIDQEGLQEIAASELSED